MEVSFRTQNLKQLYTNLIGVEELPEEVIKKFFYHIQAVAAALSLVDLKALRSLPLIPDVMEHDYFIELGSGWKLSLQFQIASTTERVVVDLFSIKEKEEVVL